MPLHPSMAPAMASPIFGSKPKFIVHVGLSINTVKSDELVNPNLSYRVPAPLLESRPKARRNGPLRLFPWRRKVCTPEPAASQAHLANHSGVMIRANAYLRERVSKVCAGPSKWRAEYLKAIRWGDAVLFKREPTCDEGHCCQFLFL